MMEYDSSRTLEGLAYAEARDSVDATLERLWEWASERWHAHDSDGEQRIRAEIERVKRERGRLDADLRLRVNRDGTAREVERSS